MRKSAQPVLHVGARIKNMEPLQNLLKWIEGFSTICATTPAAPEIGTCKPPSTSSYIMPVVNLQHSDNFNLNKSCKVTLSRWHHTFNYGRKVVSRANPMCTSPYFTLQTSSCHVHVADLLRGRSRPKRQHGPQASLVPTVPPEHQRKKWEIPVQTLEPMWIPQPYTSRNV